MLHSLQVTSVPTGERDEENEEKEEKEEKENEGKKKEGEEEKEIFTLFLEWKFCLKVVLEISQNPITLI